MQDHYNLYYLFLDDYAKTVLPDDICAKILKNIKVFYRKSKPP